MDRKGRCELTERRRAWRPRTKAAYLAGDELPVIAAAPLEA